MGHIIADVFNINPLDLAKKTGLQDEKNVLDKMIEVLSEYASKPGVDEIIAECYSAVLSGVNNEFALKFTQECDKKRSIIFKSIVSAVLFVWRKS